MENMRNYCQRNLDPAEAIAVLMEISDVSKRLACTLYDNLDFCYRA